MVAIHTCSVVCYKYVWATCYMSGGVVNGSHTCSVVGYKYVWATVIYCYMSSKSIVSTGCPHTVSCRVVVHVRLLMQVSVLLIRSKEEKNRKFL